MFEGSQRLVLRWNNELNQVYDKTERGGYFGWTQHWNYCDASSHESVRSQFLVAK